MGNTPKPDLTSGIAFHDLPDGGKVLGTVGEDEVIVLRRGDAIFACGAYCTHYHGALMDGIATDETLRCPLHHACFSIRTGEALRAPALDPIQCWRVERIGDTVFVRDKLPSPVAPAGAAGKAGLRSVVIVGGGAAGLAAAEMLRREGYAGELTLISADDSPPCDRPNLSKDFLAGTAPEEWMPLRPPEFYTQQRIELLLDTPVASLDLERRCVKLGNGRELPFDALLLATGAEPVRLEVPGASPSTVCYLRSFADSRAIVAKAGAARSAVVVGASFIGLEVAASLRERSLEVHVVAPEKLPMLRTLGPEAGRWVQSLHESHGVKFHLGKTLQRMDGRRATLSDGTVLEADFVVLGVGVRPSVSLASSAGLTLDRGVLVNEYLETSAPGVYAAGDIARWPDPYSGERIRVEHWVVAERQGQVAARNILGRREKFTAVPFFWCQYYDVAIRYLGHAEHWDSIQIEGSFEQRDCTLTYLRNGKRLAVATVQRDLQNLQAELAFEAAAASSGKSTEACSSGC
jgi:NADPH-dependent 2,4-dienoyl-CoA reductase/sulfur reductase-like enzyme/nitrite reductase/ring-hydroxylating ferredoxin subunit